MRADRANASWMRHNGHRFRTTSTRGARPCNPRAFVIVPRSRRVDAARDAQRKNYGRGQGDRNPDDAEHGRGVRAPPVGPSSQLPGALSVRLCTLPLRAQRRGRRRTAACPAGACGEGGKGADQDRFGGVYGSARRTAGADHSATVEALGRRLRVAGSRRSRHCSPDRRERSG